MRFYFMQGHSHVLSRRYRTKGSDGNEPGPSTGFGWNGQPGLFRRRSSPAREGFDRVDQRLFRQLIRVLPQASDGDHWRRFLQHLSAHQGQASQRGERHQRQFDPVDVCQAAKNNRASGASFEKTDLFDRAAVSPHSRPYRRDPQSWCRVYDLCAQAHPPPPGAE